MAEIKVLLGSPLEHRSEQEFLRQLRSDLAERGQDVLIFGNVRAGSERREIDFVVITETRACVVELKSSRVTVFGDVRGVWRAAGAHGSKDLGNPYDQVRREKYAIATELERIHRSHPSAVPAPPRGKKFVDFLEASVCFYPGIPEGSEIPGGDWMAAILGYPNFLEWFLRPRDQRPHLTMSQWREVAAHLHLFDEDRPESRLFTKPSAQETVRVYEKQVRAAYLEPLKPYVPIAMVLGDRCIAIEDLVEGVRRGQHLAITGRSGSGKSHVVKHAVGKLLEARCVPIFLRAKYFEADLDRWIAGEIAPLFDGSPEELIESSFLAGREVYLVIDGLNETAASRREYLFERIRAWVRSEPRALIITTQSKADLPNDPSIQSIAIQDLTDADRAELARVHVGAEVTLAPILGVLATPLDIEIAASTVAQPGLDLRNRYDLYSAFVRNRLGSDPSGRVARDLLVDLAGRMATRVAWALPLHEVETASSKLAQDSATASEAMDRIARSMADLQSPSRFAFRHEMFLRFFAAESLLRSSGSMTDAARALSQPKNSGLAEFVIGATQTAAEARLCLRAAASAGLYDDALEGRVGPVAAAAAHAELDSFLESARDELADRRLIVLAPGGTAPRRPIVRLEPPLDRATRTETLQERRRRIDEEAALAHAAGVRFLKGEKLESLFALLRIASDVLCSVDWDPDPRTARRERELRDAACDLLLPRAPFETPFPLEDWETKLRDDESESAESASAPLVAKVLAMLHYRRIAAAIRGDWDDPAAVQDACSRFLQSVERQPVGILWWLATLAPWTSARDTGHLLGLAGALLSTPYPCLQDYVVELVCSATRTLRRDEPEFRSLQRLIGDWSCDVESLEDHWSPALVAVGQLDGGCSVETAAREIEKLLKGDRKHDASRDLRPTAVWNNQYDTLDGPAYREAIRALDDGARRELALMVVLEAEPGRFDWLAIGRELIGWGDRRLEPAFQRWAEMPTGDETSVASGLFNHRVACWIIAMVELGSYLDDPPEAQGPRSTAKSAWTAVGQLLFWANKPGLSDPEVKANSKDAVSRLRGPALLAAAEPFWHVRRHLRVRQREKLPSFRDPVPLFGEDVRQIALSNLRTRGELLTLARSHTIALQLPLFLVELLGEVGDLVDIPVLDGLSDDPDLGPIAIEAIRQIRSRFESVPPTGSNRAGLTPGSE